MNEKRCKTTKQNWIFIEQISYSEDWTLIYYFGTILIYLPKCLMYPQVQLTS